jgi:hypothetical protein
MLIPAFMAINPTIATVVKRTLLTLLIVYLLPPFREDLLFDKLRYVHRLQLQLGP